MRLATLFFLALTLFLASCATQTTVANNLSEREANEIVVLLSSRGIEAMKTPAAVSAIAGAGAAGGQKWDIRVPSNQVTESISILNQAGLPRAKGTSLLDLFGAQTLVPSDLQDKIRYQEGLSEQLATTIRKMDGIIDANVQITFPQDEESEKELTASVYIKHRGVLDNPNSLLITKIKRLIASSVTGLDIDNVSVIADRALYADISLPEQQKHYDLGPELVSIWGIVLAKESANQFRLIFYSFLILVFIVLCLFGWIVWKCFPLMRGHGWKGLLRPHPYSPKKEELQSAVEETDEEQR